jgi:hypothetical protein
MQSPPVADELQVSAEGLRMQGGWCEAVGGKLAGNAAPTTTGPSWLASAAGVGASNAQIAAAGIRCTFRVQATATKLAAAATSYAEQEVESAARFRTLDTPKVC